MIERYALAILLAAAGLGALGQAAYARYGGPPGSERMRMMPFEAVLRPDQKQLLYAIVKADRTKLESLHRRLHAAREALIEKLLSQDPSVDVSNQVAELKAAQAAMIDERVAIAVAVRKLLSPKQLKDAAQFHAKFEELHRQEAALLQQMESGASSGPEDPGDEGAMPGASGVGK